MSPTVILIFGIISPKPCRRCIWIILSTLRRRYIIFDDDLGHGNHSGELLLFVGCIVNFVVSYLICMFQDSVPAGSYNDPFLSSVCLATLTQNLTRAPWCDTWFVSTRSLQYWTASINLSARHFNEWRQQRNGGSILLQRWEHKPRRGEITSFRIKRRETRPLNSLQDWFAGIDKQLFSR